MAKLTWQIETSAGTVTEDGPVISDANMARFVDYLWVQFPQLDGNNDPLPRNAANEAQAFRDWADKQWRETKRDVLRKEKEAAAALARDAVGDLE